MANFFILMKLNQFFKGGHGQGLFLIPLKLDWWGGARGAGGGEMVSPPPCAGTSALRGVAIPLGENFY